MDALAALVEPDAVIAAGDLAIFHRAARQRHRACGQRSDKAATALPCPSRKNTKGSPRILRINGLSPISLGQAATYQQLRRYFVALMGGPPLAFAFLFNCFVMTNYIAGDVP